MPLKDPVKRAEYNAQYRRDRVEKFRLYDAAYYAAHADERKAYDAARYRSRLRKFRVSNAKWAAQNPEKRSAQSQLRYAVKTGKIARANSCQECGAVGKVEAHHPDYSKPLRVEWLCKSCHGLTRRFHE